MEREQGEEMKGQKRKRKKSWKGEREKEKKETIYLIP